MTDVAALISSVLAAGAALSGVFLKSKIDRKERQDVQNELWRKDKIDRRLKNIEELYTHLDGYASWIVANSEAHAAHMQGKIGPDVLSTLLRDAGAERNYSVSKMKFLVEAHFPELYESYSELQNAAGQVIRLQNDSVFPVTAGRTTGDASNSMIEYLDVKSRFNQVRISLLNRVAGLVSTSDDRQNDLSRRKPD